ncbi:winged helix-turn-helix domain-containing protein [Rhizobium panacihumi]|uniref:winged helix-turn-helix domain-containing protein n=1 Tax=Rhizobium panacihumi TaxID=2008450 RepID=UPI003D7B8A28
MGFAAHDRFKLLIGTGEDHGVIRLRKDRNGALKANERSFTGGVTAFQISLFHRPEFVDRTEKAVPCQWEKIDLTTVEIILPKWADETGPRKKTSISSIPPHEVAAREDAARKAREAVEAEQRRRDNDLDALERETIRQITNALAVAPAAFLDELGLTKTEAEVLRILVAKRGQVVTKDSLLTLLYMSRPDEAPEEKIIDVYVCKLRAKLPETCQIKTRHGSGYQFIGQHEDLFERAAA